MSIFVLSLSPIELELAITPHCHKDHPSMPSLWRRSNSGGNNSFYIRVIQMMTKLFLPWFPVPIIDDECFKCLGVLIVDSLVHPSVA